MTTIGGVSFPLTPLTSAQVPANTPRGAASLPDPNPLALEGDVGAQVAAMLVASLNEMKKTGRASREAAEAALVSAQHEQLEQMHAAANKRWMSGLATGVLGIGAGVATGSSGIPAELEDRKVREGLAAGLGGLEKLTEAGMGASAAMNDREVEAAKMRAETAGRTLDKHNEDLGDLDKSFAKVSEFLSGWNSGRDAARSAAIHRA